MFYELPEKVKNDYFLKAFLLIILRNAYIKFKLIFLLYLKFLCKYLKFLLKFFFKLFGNKAYLKNLKTFKLLKKCCLN